jgi:3-oxoacyl-[acyl-carrier-protein] synthase II
VSVLIAASAVRTCFGADAETLADIISGRDGAGPLRYADAEALNVHYGYNIQDTDAPALRASSWLAECATRALRASGVDPRRERVVAVMGTGLRELRAVEQWAVDGAEVEPDRLHFTTAVRSATGIDDVCTISNACSAGGYALAVAQDLLELGEVDAVLVGGADSMTESMLAMIGRVTDEPTERVRPFDVDRTGVLLGDGAAAVVLVREPADGVVPLGRLLATGLSCDATHETAPDVTGVRRAMADAYARAGRSDVDLVIAHGTGTALNDPMEATAIRDELGDRPLVTAVKGAIGHTSGPSALHSLAVALGCLRDHVVPPIVGLRKPIAEAAGLRLVRGEPVSAFSRLIQVNAFGFGGLNAVSLVESL